MPTDKLKVLISSRSFGTKDSGAMRLLQDEKLTPILNTSKKKLNEEELIEMVDDVIGIIAGTEKITEKIMSHAGQLKVISRYGIGLDNIDLKAANQKVILVYNTPETPSVAVAELVLSLILNLLRKISKVDRNIKENMWKPEMGNLLTGKTIGIIGLGRIGKKLVQLLEPFDLNILAYEINPDKTFISNHNINLVPLNKLISDSDIITLHVPITEKTRYMIGKKELSKMKENAILINTARGGLIDEDALYASLKEKKIAGVAIDAFEEEPYTGRLKELDNVILTPHIGTLTVETRKQMEIEATNNLIDGLRKVGII